MLRLAPAAAAGIGLTVIVTVLLHPFILVYVMTLAPAPTEVTNPKLLTVATPVVPDTHGDEAAGVPEPVNWVVDPRQIFNVPVIVGSGLTVMVTLLVLVQPPAVLVSIRV